MSLLESQRFEKFDLLHNASQFFVEKSFFFLYMNVEELKSETKTWNLASDAKLLEYLQAFSVQILEKTKSVSENVENLLFEVNESEVSLRNTFNEFLMLGNTQFIENVSS